MADKKNAVQLPQPTAAEVVCRRTGPNLDLAMVTRTFSARPRGRRQLRTSEQHEPQPAPAASPTIAPWRPACFHYTDAAARRGPETP